MKKLIRATALGACAAFVPMALHAGPVAGDREFSLSGTGTSDKKFDNNPIGVSGDLGWYTSDNLSLGIRQSASYAGGDNSDDIWTGSTRGYVDYNFLDGSARPFDDGAWAYVIGVGFNF